MKNRASLLLFVAGLAVGSSSSTAADPERGYIYPGVDLHIQAWLPPAPARDSLAQATDVQTIFSLRPEVDTARGTEAHEDDVYKAEDVARRFDYVLGIHLDAKSTPKTLHLMQTVENDSEWLTRPVKHKVADGGRQRPFVDYPALHTCAITYAKLPETGSYPSGHAALGWLWGNILAELVPEHADALISRGLEFGESRVVCGFHYPSDIVAGRLAAGVLLTRLHADKQFERDLADARSELAAAMRRH